MRSRKTQWTTPADLRTRLERLWTRGDVLAAIVRGESLFPHEVSLRRPNAREIAHEFGAVMDWVAALQAESRSVRGFGYELRYERVANRVQGSNEIPVSALFPTEQDALRFIGRERDTRRARRLIEMTRTRFSVLEEWMARRPLVMLQHAAEWERILAVLDWFAVNPRPGVYLRQLDIPSVDTKFIEAHRALLMELLDCVLPPGAIDPEATGVRGFARRYGLRDEPPLIRFRILDPTMYIRGLSDLSVPADEFARLRLWPASEEQDDATHGWETTGTGPQRGMLQGGRAQEGTAEAGVVQADIATSDGTQGGVVQGGIAIAPGYGAQGSRAQECTAEAGVAQGGIDEVGVAQGGLAQGVMAHGGMAQAQTPHLRVFVTENRINGLAFPSLPGSIVIFGLGYAVERLADIPWMHDVDVWYWGDIDTHGFAILNRLRAGLRHVRSLLMDRSTLESHRSLWVQEPENKRYTGDPKHLRPDEYALFDDLRHDRLGPRIRLEQERIGYAWVKRALAHL